MRVSDQLNQSGCKCSRHIGNLALGLIQSYELVWGCFELVTLFESFAPTETAGMVKRSSGLSVLVVRYILCSLDQGDRLASYWCSEHTRCDPMTIRFWCASRQLGLIKRVTQLEGLIAEGERQSKESDEPNVCWDRSDASGMSQMFAGIDQMLVGNDYEEFSYEDGPTNNQLNQRKFEGGPGTLLSLGSIALFEPCLFRSKVWSCGAS